MGVCASKQRTAGAGHRGAALLVVLSVTCIALLVYAATLHRDVGWADSAELALQADRLGVTHPPGYPLHTWLGKLTILLSARLGGRSPARATHLLSAICTALTAGLLVLLARLLVGDLLAGTAAAMVFAFLPPVWDAAVITEVYPVGVLFAALALLCLLRWWDRPTGWRLVVAGLAFGLALGAYLPNLLLAPGCAVLLIGGARDGAFAARVGAAALYAALAGTLGLAILSWSYFRSRALPPLGTACVPDTPARFLSYLAGAEYRETPVLTPALILGRLGEITLTFGRSFLWVGLLVALLGVVSQWRADRHTGLMLLAVFGANILFFSLYAATDYGTMIAVAYLVAALWFGRGLAAIARLRLPVLPPVWAAVLRRGLAALGAVFVVASTVADLFGLGKPGFGRAQSLALAGGLGLLGLTGLLHNRAATLWTRRNAMRVGVTILSAVLVAALLDGQARARLTHSANGDVSVFVHLSFDMFPPGALVVAQWDKLPPLLYHQHTEGLRPDIAVLEPLADWHPLLERGDRPVLVDEVDPVLAARYQFIVRPHGWYLLRRRVEPQ